MSDRHRSMSRRQFLRYGAAGVVAASLARPRDLVAAPDRPNILFILTDDQRWDAMSCMGHPFLHTPHMDRLAREGVMFENAFVTTSLCSPSRASFLTGTYAHKHGVVDNTGKEFDPAFPTFAGMLQAAGYETGFIGKWHMARHANPRPGFDYWLSFVGQGTYENPELNENGKEVRAEGYITDLLTDYAPNWLKRERDKPFCLILSHKAVHGPFTPAPRHRDAFAEVSMAEPESFRDTFEGKPQWQRRITLYGSRKAEWLASEGKPVPDRLPPADWDGRDPARLNYYRTLLAVDEGLGRVFETLDAAGQMDSTLIVFASDNGYFHGEHRRGDKRLMYEESIRIPLLMRYPRIIAPRTRVSEMCLNIDLAPTLLDLAGVTAPASMQGCSVMPLLKGDHPTWRDSLLYEYFREDWLPGIPLMLGVRTDRWKYVSYPDIEDLEELYDLREDPHEMDNLASDAAHAATLDELRGRLRSLNKDTGYPEGKQLGAPPVVRGPVGAAPPPEG
jgi:N-acetylglucosamine-6-sulfatase